MTLPQRLCVFLAASHLVVVVCGASGLLPGRQGGPAARPLVWYAKMSGASSRFGYYAPEVGSLYRAYFVLRDDQGRTWRDSFEEAASPEARLRLSGIASSAFANGAAEALPEARVRLVKSWAASLFSRHPDATSLTVVVEVYDVPPMAEYRAGRRPCWAVVYQAEVQRQSADTAERGAR